MDKQEIFSKYTDWLKSNYPESSIINEENNDFTLEFYAVFRTFKFLYLILMSIFFTPIGWIIYFLFTWKKEKVRTIAKFDKEWKVIWLNHRYNFLKDNYNNKNGFIQKDNSWWLTWTQIIVISIILIWIIIWWMQDKF